MEIVPTMPTKKQARKRQLKRRHAKQRLTHRQAQLRARDELWHDMRPLLIQHNLRDASDEAWLEFAVHVMHDATALYDELEFSGLLFHPADAIYAVADEFNARVPPPDQFHKLSKEEQADYTTEAYVHVIAQFVSPEFQQDVLDALGECRQRLRRERQMDKLALASAVEMILRSDDRPEIWGTCGLFFEALQASLDKADQFEDAREKALQAAQAIQPDVTSEHDLVEGSPAERAYWKVVDKTPGLADYLEASRDLEEEEMLERHELDSELASELFDPDELQELADKLVADFQAQGIELLRTSDTQQDAQAAVARLPQFIQAHIAAERFEQLLEDLQDLIGEKEHDDLVIQRAKELRVLLTESDIPYWQNVAFQQLVFDALVEKVLAEADELDQDDNDA